MFRLARLLAVAVLCAAASASSSFADKRQWFTKAHAEAMRANFARAPPKGGSGSRVQNITFKNPLASQFYVDGTTIPMVDFDVGPSWAGLLPISNSTNETRKLFFWFFPPGPQGNLDDLIFWTNGGPGCSALEGWLQENGPVYWPPGTAKPIQNMFSWTNLSSMIWIEQPVGTGYSQGVPNITNEDELAAQLVGFMQQFLNVFSELKGKNFYVTGESYAGMFVPYIANFIYENPTLLDLRLQGIWINDPVIGSSVLQGEVPVADFVHEYSGVFALNQSFLAQMDALSAKCGYAGYAAKHLTYPPTGLFPMPSGANDDSCDIWSEVANAALLVNPAFDIYRIFDTWPILWDVLGFPGSFPDAQTLPLYFDRTDVKQVLHAPVNVSWAECSNGNVFVGKDGDTSLPPSVTVLPNVIEKSQRSVIIHGLADFILLAQGARMTIQNMTWAGKQGFQTPIQNESFVVDGMGVMGTSHVERGLTYVEVLLAGHMVPQFSPQAAFRVMQYLVGVKSSPTD